MTKKDYVAIAKCIAETREKTEPRDQWAAGYEAAINECARRLCNVFKADNPRFDRARFLRACGVES